MKIALNRRTVFLGSLVVVSGFTAAALIFWFFRHECLEFLVLGRDFLFVALQGMHPVLFFTIMAIAPAFAFPVSPFLLLSSAYGLIPAIIGSCLALSLNMIFCYWIAGGIFHPFVKRIVKRWGYEIPTVYPHEYARLTLILRITPGLPFFVQSYILGLAHIPFRIYLLVSLPLQWIIAIAFIMVGDSLFHGRSGLMVAGVSMLLIIILIIKILRDRYGTNGPGRPVSE